MKRSWRLRAWIMVILAALGLAALGGCGVPLAARDLAEQQAVAAPEPRSDAEVRAALRQQVQAWDTFQALLRRREWFGLLAVEPAFVALADRTAAAARRQAALMDAGQDDPALNRRMLIEFRRLWSRAAETLRP